MEKFLDTSDGGRIRYELHEGDDRRRPLLVLRGLGGGLNAWREFCARLALSRTVIAPEYRGSRDSSAVPLGATTRLFARDARELLDTLGIAAADAFGVSFGGMVATRLALDASERVSRLALASTPVRGREVLRGILRNRLELVGCFVKAPASVDACLAQQVVSEDAPEDVRRELERTASEMAAPRGELVKQLAAAALHDVGSELARIAQPALVLVGADDPLLSPARASVMANAIPGARFEIVSGAGHDLTTEAPEQTAEHVLGFLDGHVRREQPLKEPRMFGE
jgi:3-oxoadipate enol-lactonase